MVPVWGTQFSQSIYISRGCNLCESPVERPLPRAPPEHYDNMLLLALSIAAPCPAIKELQSNTYDNREALNKKAMLQEGQPPQWFPNTLLNHFSYMSLSQCVQGKDRNILFFCTSGRHRSVAAKEFFQFLLEHYNLRMETEHLSSLPFPDKSHGFANRSQFRRTEPPCRASMLSIILFAEPLCSLPPKG